MIYDPPPPPPRPPLLELNSKIKQKIDFGNLCIYGVFFSFFPGCLGYDRETAHVITQSLATEHHERAPYYENGFLGTAGVPKEFLAIPLVSH